jgi:hypothetical protein
MMQSVALTDSCQHDEDFVIVEALESDIEAEQSNHNHNYNRIPTYVYDDDDDDEYDDLDSEYDYCEDAPSVVQSYATKDSHALETVTFQHDFLDYPLSYNLNQQEGHGENSPSSHQSACLPKILSPGILTSLFPFGEAHSENIDEAEAESDSVTVDGSASIAASEISASTRDEGEKESERQDGVDSVAAPSTSGSSVAGDGGSDSVRYYTEPELFAAVSLPTKREESSRTSASSSSASSSVVSAYQKTKSVSDDCSVRSTSSKTSSRISNKKMRKQLKLAKKEKAAAAAAAAAALSPVVNRNKKATRKVIQMAVRSTNKKQVACATQGLADYREEVIRNNKSFR